MKSGELSHRRSANPSAWTWLLVGGSLLVLLVAARLLNQGSRHPNQQGTQTTVAGAGGSLTGEGAKSPSQHSPGVRQRLSAQQIVTDKLAQFSAKRREVVRALAARAHLPVPAPVEQFFDALGADHWDEAQVLFKSLNEMRKTDAGRDLQPFWRAIVETYGAAEQVRSWPAQKLLDYGNAVLEALPQGMVYVGGTDAGCFIPLMLNEASGEEQHVMLTQNALADASYLDYLSFLYQDQLKTLTSEDSQRAFQDYLADAQKRLAHDQSSPDEPKQVQPGENISAEDGNVQVSGQVAVMQINERLLQRLMELNPGVSFALQESFPFKSTYAQAVPLGPVMELGVTAQNALTSDMAAQSVAYWQNTANQLLADPEALSSSDALNAYAKLMVSQFNLLQSHDFASEAEQMLQQADRLTPGSPEVVFNYVQLLIKQNRFADALQVTAGALQAAPDNAQFQALNQQLQAQPSRR